MHIGVKENGALDVCGLAGYGQILGWDGFILAIYCNAGGAWRGGRVISGLGEYVLWDENKVSP